MALGILEPRNSTLHDIVSAAACVGRRCSAAADFSNRSALHAAARDVLLRGRRHRMHRW